MPRPKTRTPEEAAAQLARARAAYEERQDGPEGRRPRGIRMTDAEYTSVVNHLSKLRARSQKQYR